jgi:hypothetical protein
MHGSELVLAFVSLSDPRLPEMVFGFRFAQKLNGTLYTADQKLCTTANKITNSKLIKNKS